VCALEKAAQVLVSAGRLGYLRLLGIVLCVGATACGISETPVGGDSATASFTIMLSKTASSLITRVEVVVTGLDMAEIRHDLSAQGDVYTGIIVVPAGVGREFTLNGYDAAGTLTYSGTESADVIVAERIQVQITLRRVSPSVGDIEITGTLLQTP
jgi:hypothetical protein